MAIRLNARQEALNLVGKLKNTAGNVIGRAGIKVAQNVPALAPIANTVAVANRARQIPVVQQKINQVPNMRVRPNAPTVGQAVRHAIQPKQQLPYLLTNQPRTGNRFMDTTNKYLVNTAGQALKSTLDIGTFGLANLPAARPTNIVQKGGRALGGVAGFIGSTLGAPGAALGRVGLAGEGITRAVLPRTAPKLAARVAPVIGSELAQTGAFAGTKGLLKQDFDPARDLAAGIGVRGALGAVGKAVGRTIGQSQLPEELIKKGKALGIKGVNPQVFDLHPEDIDEYSAIAFKLAKTKEGLSNRELDTVDRFLKTFFPGATPDKVSNKRLTELLKYVVDVNLRAPKAERTKFPGLGFVGDTQTGQVRSASGLTPDVDQYIKKLTGAQKEAGSLGPQGVKAKAGNFYSRLKSALVDSTAPIEDALSAAEKKGKFRVRPTGDVRLQIDRVLRSKTLASQFAEDNGMVDVIRNTKDLAALDQYMIAKQSNRVREFGIQTGRDKGMDERLIEELAPQYEEQAQKVNAYSQKLLDYSVETGLVDKNLAAQLKQKYPEYVPLQRIFNELEKQNVYQGASKAVASLSKQTVVQKIKGSEREIASPIESLLLKTQTAFEQGEKNKAARMLASYQNLPGMNELIRPLKEGENAAHTFSYLDNGVKKTFQTTPEIAAAAKNLNQEQMNIVMRIIAAPTRMLQLGATGLNIPFLVTNLAKDQMTAFVNSNKAASTSLLNPVNFGRALFSAIKHDDLYDEVIRNAAGGTSFDIARQAPDLSVKRLRAGRNIGSKVAFTVKRPQELLRAMENIVGRGEEATRIQQYRGTLKALLKEGRTMEDAKLLAAKAARENTANFARKGDVGKVINYIIPFFNAGIQGSRVFVRNVKNRPVATGAKVATAIFMPVAATTAWNLSDPERKQIYADIDESEKQNNLILIPPGATKNDKGQWNVIKIPLPPGLSNLGSVVRRTMESANGMDPVRFGEIANNLLTAGTSVDISSPNKIASTFVPQAVKPFVEGYTNTNLFTGNKIVPDSLKDLPAQDQVRESTAPGAKAIGNAIGISPLHVENFARTAAGGLGSQILGSESPAENLQRRFTKAYGGELQEKEFESINKLKEQSATERNDARKRAEQTAALVQQATTMEEKKAILLQNVKDKEELKKVLNVMRDQQLEVTASERAARALPIKQRATYVKQQLQGRSQEEKKAILIDLVRKKIVTEDVLRSMVEVAQ